MEIDDQIKLGHFLFSERKCKVCGEIKDLVTDFYLTRKERGTLPSAYSYECKICSIRRVIKNRKKHKKFPDWSYPDW